MLAVSVERDNETRVPFKGEFKPGLQRGTLTKVDWVRHQTCSCNFGNHSGTIRGTVVDTHDIRERWKQSIDNRSNNGCLIE
ncbi:hypothetical protein GCM10009692_12370 [Leucobacter aridicollis]